VKLLLHRLHIDGDIEERSSPNFMVVLGGCSALITAPVSIPAWYIIGMRFLIRPTLGAVWRGCTGAHALLFGMRSVYLGTVWFDTRARRLDDPSLEATATFSVLTSILALVCALRWWVSRPRPERPVQPGWSVWVQCVTALIAGGVLVAFFLT
jgi:hypothetical protein